MHRGTAPCTACVTVCSAVRPACVKGSEPGAGLRAQPGCVVCAGRHARVRVRASACACAHADARVCVRACAYACRGVPAYAAVVTGWQYAAVQLSSCPAGLVLNRPPAAVLYCLNCLYRRLGVQFQKKPNDGKMKGIAFIKGEAWVAGGGHHKRRRGDAACACWMW